MKDSKLISVIVPVYNVEKQIDRCINSLLKQTYQNIEIILVVDGSPDSCAAICDVYAIKDSRIKVIHKKNGGVSYSRNTAINIIAGEYSLDHETIKKCFDAAKTADYDIVCFGYNIFFDYSDRFDFVSKQAKKPQSYENSEELRKSFAELNKWGLLDFVTDKMIKCSIIRNRNINFDGYYNMGGEDAVFMLSIFPFVKKFRIIKDCFYNYFRRKDESVTVKFNEGKFDRYYSRLQITYKYMIENNCYDKDFVLKKYCEYAMWFYDSLFSKTCNLKLTQRYIVLKNAFLKPELYTGFYNDVVKYAKKTDNFSDFSGSSFIALKLISKKRYLLAWLLHVVTLIKNR